MKKALILPILATLLSTNSIAQKDTHSTYSVKFSPTQLTMGELHFAFEGRVSKQSSLEVAAGPTISRVGLNTFIFDYYLNVGEYVNMDSKIGGFLSLNYRYYPLKNYATAPHGFYLGPELKFRNYTTKYEQVLTSTMLSELTEEAKNETGTINQYSFRFITGYQFWIGNNFSMDVFMGFGFGTTYMVGYRQENDYPNYHLAKHKENYTAFSGTFGLKVGIGGNRKN